MPDFVPPEPFDLDSPAFVQGFHGGHREFMGRFYQATFQTVDMAVGRVLHGADRETVVHDVYLRLLDRPELRRGFAGGSIKAWLAIMAYNLAVDFWRRHRREGGLGDEASVPEIDLSARQQEERIGVRLLIERFRREILPAKWDSVFQARFVEQLDQREAARRAGVGRTTLAYRELRIRKLLRAFVRRGDLP